VIEVLYAEAIAWQRRRPTIEYSPSARDYFANKDTLLELVLVNAGRPRQ
jgi:hypothetical protein